MIKPGQRLSPATEFKPGQSGNPGGYAKGVRNRLNATFLRALADDFDAHGKEAIKNCREQDPAAYVRAVAALLPKEVELKRPLEDMANDELISALNALTSYLAAQEARGGTDETAGGEPPVVLPTVQ